MEVKAVEVVGVVLVVEVIEVVEVVGNGTGVVKAALEEAAGAKAV